MEQRQRGEHGARLVVAHGEGDHPGVGDLVAVRARRELRGAGRPARVQVAREVVGPRRRALEAVRGRFTRERPEIRDCRARHGVELRRGLPRRGRPQRKERAGAGLGGERPGQRPDAPVELRAGGDDHLRPRQAHELGGVPCGQRRVDGRRDPDRLGREDRGDHLAAVDRQDRHGVAAADAQAGVHRRRPVDVVGELGERARRGPLPALGVGQAGEGRPLRPQLGGADERVVGALRQAAVLEGGALDLRGELEAGRGRPHELGRGRRRVHGNHSCRLVSLEGSMNWNVHYRTVLECQLQFLQAAMHGRRRVGRRGHLRRRHRAAAPGGVLADSPPGAGAAAAAPRAPRRSGAP